MVCFLAVKNDYFILNPRNVQHTTFFKNLLAFGFFDVINEDRPLFSPTIFYNLNKFSSVLFAYESVLELIVIFALSLFLFIPRFSVSNFYEWSIV